MARTHLEREPLYRRNARLESFLRRSLPADEYDRIRSYAPCVVHCPGAEGPAFRHAVLTDGRLYTTDHPPKTAQPIAAFQDVENIAMADDPPLFLRGEDRDNCRHVRLFVRLQSPATPSSSSPLEQRSPSADSLISTPNSDTRPWRWLLNKFRTPAKPTKRSPPTSPRQTETISEGNPNSLTRNLLESHPSYSLPALHNDPVLSPRYRRSDDRRLMSPIPQDHSERLTAGSEPLLYSTRCLSVESDDDTPRRRTGSTSGRMENVAAFHRPNSELKHPILSSRFKVSSDTYQLMSQSADTVISEVEEDDEEDRIVNSSREDSTHLDDSPASTWNRLQGKKFLQKSHSALDNYPRSEITPSVLRIPRSKSTSDSLLVQPKKLAFTDWPVQESKKAGNNISLRKEVNVYILDPSSPFIACLFAAWENFLIRSTLTIDDDSWGSLTVQNHKAEVLENLLNELHKELQDTEMESEVTFQLLQELVTAAKKNLTIRKLFWKKPFLLRFLLQRLRNILSNSQVDENSDDVLQNREDDLEMALLMLKTLSLMFRETEMVVYRWQHLASQQHEMLKELLSLVLYSPAVPCRFLNTTRRMLTSFKEYATAAWEHLPEADLIRLLADTSNEAVMLLFELIVSCQQANAMLTDCDLSLSSLLDILAQNSEINNFLGRAVTQLLFLIAPGQENSLNGHQSVLLYKHLYVMKAMLDSNSKLRMAIINSYNEEFRYYVHADLVEARIPSECPLRGTIRQLFHYVTDYVTKKPSCSLIHPRERFWIVQEG